MGCFLIPKVRFPTRALALPLPLRQRGDRDRVMCWPVPFPVVLAWWALTRNQLFRSLCPKPTSNILDYELSFCLYLGATVSDPALAEYIAAASDHVPWLMSTMIRPPAVLGSVGTETGRPSSPRGRYDGHSSIVSLSRGHRAQLLAFPASSIRRGAAPPSSRLDRTTVRADHSSCR